MPLRLGIIGGGAMGARHVRVISGTPDADLLWVADPDEQTRASIGARYSVEVLTAPRTMANVDAVIVAAPTHTHAQWCFEAIEAELPFLVEKPLSTDQDEVEEVAAAARKAGVAFTVGFVERFNAAVRTLEGIVEIPIYFGATRHSPYAARIRTGVGGDLLIHDIDLAIRILGLQPESVTASLAHMHPSSAPGAEDIAEAHIRFVGGAVASLSASRLAQRKIRTLTVANLEITAEVDLLRQDITIYRDGLSAAIKEDYAGYRQETIMEIPQLRYRVEPLVAQFTHFMDLVRGDVDPEQEAAGIILPHRVLAAAERSAREGRTVPIDYV